MRVNRALLVLLSLGIMMPCASTRTSSHGPTRLPQLMEEYNHHMYLPLSARSEGRPSIGWQPALSPDGQQIAFVREERDGHSDVYVMNADGSGLRNLTRTPEADEETPIFSPDGSTIVFASNRGGRWDIYSMPRFEADPTARSVIGNINSDERHPSFSPDGDLLAFSSNCESHNWDLYTAPVAGGTWTRLTTDPTVERFPVLGADERTLAYRRELNAESEIYVMDMISRTTRRLTDNPGFDGYPALSLDGSGVVFASTRSGGSQLYGANIAGAGMITLTAQPGYRAHTPRLADDGHTLIYAAGPVTGPYTIHTMTYQSPLELIAGRGTEEAQGQCDWTSGVLALGWGAMWRSTGDESYARSIQAWANSCKTDMYTATHVNDGLLGYAALIAYQLDSQPDDLAFAQHIGDYLAEEAPRTTDGALAHFDAQVWADTLISVVPFFVEMNRVTGNEVYLDEAAAQIMSHAEVLQDPATSLLRHAWDEDTAEYLSTSYWARGNSWNMIASAQLLDALPVAHPLRSSIITIAQAQAEALVGRQDDSGLWHTVVDRPTFYLESSGSAGIIYGLLRGVQAGWLPSHLEAGTRDAQLALWRKVSSDGTLTDVSGPTGPMGNEASYNAILHETMQLYGQGMGLLALSPQ